MSPSPGFGKKAFAFVLRAPLPDNALLSGDGTELLGLDDHDRVHRHVLKDPVDPEG